MDASETAESFRSLLLRHRGRTGLIQRDLAARAGVSARSVQDWEAGVTFPTAERLQGLIRALLEGGGLTPGREISEALQLWTAVEREAPRMHAPFDSDWFGGLLASQGSSRSGPPGAALLTAPAARQSRGTAERAQDWGDAPDTTGFVGRGEELAQLHQWVLEEGCRLVALLGMGGIGKTILAARLAQLVMPGFERVYWRSLRNAPPVSEWLAGAVGFLSDQQVVPMPSESEQIAALLQLLRARRCLLVLDNSETLFESGLSDGRYRAGMDGYGRILQAVGETAQQSCLVLTSREAAPELAMLGPRVRAIEVHGLGSAEAQALLADKQLVGDAEAWHRLLTHYGGNGLALKIVGETIRQVYDGSIQMFLADAIPAYGTVFGGIRRLLDTQAERLSPSERDVMTRMAVEREPITLAELSADMAPKLARSTIIEAIETLRRRSLVERDEGRATFTLQSIVLEYITDRLVETAAEEISSGKPVLLVQQPLIKAQAKDYVRQTQERLIGTPILQRLNAQHAHAEIEPTLLGLLDEWRGRPAAEQGYGPGNVVNLLRLLREDLRGMDLSRLSIRQAYLQEAEAQDAKLAGTHLTESVPAEAFGTPMEVALSANGAVLAAAMPTGDLRLWRVADRTPLATLQGHTGAVWAVAVSEDGRLVASGGVDGTVRLSEVSTGQLVTMLPGHTGAVRAVALSADGSFVASGGVDGTVRVSAAARPELAVTMPGESGMVWSVALSADGRLVASGSVDGMVRLWQPASGQPPSALKGHTGAVWGVALSGDGRLVASSGADGTVRLWETATGGLLKTLLGHTGSIWRVAVSADGRLVASVGDDRLVRVWEASSGQLLATLQGHTGALWGAGLSGDGRLVASTGEDGTVRLWETQSAKRLATLRGHTGVVWGMALSRDGTLVASGGYGRSVRLWDAGSGRQLSTLAGHSALVWAVEISMDGRLVASGSVDATVKLWEVATGQLLTTMQGHTGQVWGVAISSDGRLVASGADDATVRLWEAGSGQSLATLYGHTGPVWSVTLSGDGRLVASGSWDNTIRLWKTDGGELATILQGHTAGVRGVALSGDGSLLASGGLDGTVKLWKVPSGNPVATLQGHTAAVWSVAVSADGRLVASGSWDTTVKLWDAESGALLATLEGHTGAVMSVALSGDGRLVGSGSQDGTIRVWDTESRACLQTLRGDRHYERLDITGLTGVTAAQRAALLALGAVDTSLQVQRADEFTNIA